MINENIISLIEEIEKFSTLERMFKYGPIKTLALALNRFFNHQVYLYFEKFLVTLDEAIEYSDNNGYPVNINRVDIGELYNISRIKSENPQQFLDIYFKSLNVFLKELAKSTINEMTDNDFDLKNVSSISNFTNLKYTSTLYAYTSTLLKDYLDLLKNKPTSWVSLLSDLKRVRVSSKFISTTIYDLEKEIVAYVKLKNSVTIHQY